MEFTTNEATLIEQVSLTAEEHHINVLDDLHLALVGGGSVTVIVG